jgi:hypothetical protein
MKKNTSATRAEKVEVTLALAALSILEVEIVDRCPASNCPLCGPAVPIAA